MNVAFPHVDGPATRTVALRVTDNDGATHLVTTTVQITNVAPIANAGGPFVISENAQLTLTGERSTDADGTIVSYEWDFNYNGSNFHTDSTGVHVAFPMLDGPTMRYVSRFAPFKFRTAIFPVANIGTMLAWPILLIGLFFIPGVRIGGVSLIDVGIALFSIGVLFQLVTLPVEFDASRRAMVQLNQLGILAPEEQVGAKKVLDAAALTYVAAAAAAVLQLVRLLILRDRRN